MFLDFDPLVPVGTFLLYVCPTNYVFNHSWYDMPYIRMECLPDGTFRDEPNFWPVCVDREN